MFDKMSHRAREEACQFVVGEQVKKKGKEKDDAIKKGKELRARKKWEKNREEAMVWRIEVSGVEHPHLKDYPNQKEYGSDVYMFHKWNTPKYGNGKVYRGYKFTNEEYADMKKELHARKKAEKEEEAGAK
jgi:hypothetical protein